MIQDITKSIATGVFAVAFIGLAFAACGGDGETTTTSSSGTGTSTGSGGSGGSGGGGSSQGEQYVDAICGKFFECCNAKDLAIRVGSSGIVDYAGCRILYRTYWDAGFEPLLKESEAAGRIEFDDAAFGTCLESLKAEGCSDFSTQDFGCEQFIVPKVETGGDCVQDFECKSKKCEAAPGSNMKTCLEAPVQMPEGGACSGFDECAKGLYCDYALNTCAVKKADGQACSSDDECQNDACVDKTNGMGTCATLCQGGGPGPGPIDAELETVGTALITSACKRQFECCTEQELMDNFLKTEADCRLFSSAFLAIGFVGIHNDVVNGLVKIDPAKFASCVQSYVTLTCEESAKDDDFDCSGALEGVLADGESCTDGRQCTSTYCNEPSGQPMGTCATLPGVGAPCNDDCAEFFYCNAGTCAPQKAIGATCTDLDECSEGRCVADSMGTKACTLVCDGI